MQSCGKLLSIHLRHTKLFKDIFCRRYLIIKRNYSENVSTPKVGVLNVEFAHNLRIYRSSKSLMCLMNPKERSFPQHCILSSTTLHCRSLPLKHHLKIFVRQNSEYFIKYGIIISLQNH